MVPFSRHVGLVSLRGTIGMGIRADQVVPLLDGLRKRRSVAAVVLDIESPGGTVTGSDYIHGAAARVAADKPLYAFSGEVCASGGYLIAAAARELVVQPAAVVGSIGVISIRPLAEDLMRRMGVAVGVTKSGELKDLGAFWRQPTEKELEKERELIGEYFDLFMDRILAGRRIAEAKLRELATGEVFTGRRAVELGLADRVGSLDDTITAAADAAGIKPRRRWYGVRRSLRQRVLGGVTAELGDELVERLSMLAADRRPRT